MRDMESVPWSTFAAQAPELASFGEARLAAAPSYLASVRGAQLPRVHPVGPRVRGGRLCVYMYPTSPKGKDLRLDGRYALHAAVEDNNGTGGEFFVRGYARPVNDAVHAADIEKAGFPARDGYVLFELLLDEASATTYDDNQAPRRRNWNRATGSA
jgi:hypothetical protein